MREKETLSPRETVTRRRAFMRLGGFAAALGVPIPFARYLPEGLSPIALAADKPSTKASLRVLSDRPLNMETPPHLLDDDVTPASRLFVRNNGLTPTFSTADIRDWSLQIGGLVDRPLRLSIDDLKAQFEHHTFRLTLECGGNGRKFFAPGVSGNQWTFGAVGCPEWTGVRLRDVLMAANVQSNAVYTAHYGADAHLSGNPEKVPISRGVPIDKAMEPHNLIAWSMNGADMPIENGHPLRLVIPGWPGSCSQKWLTQIDVRDQVHDGPKMNGYAYRMPNFPVAPGTEMPEGDMKIIEAMPVKSLITHPETGVRRKTGQSFRVRGSAWSGETMVERVDISIDFGATWIASELEPAANKYAWRRWRADIAFPEMGYYEIWARATDSEGVQQPATTPGWNPRGYLNNMQHRIAVYSV